MFTYANGLHRPHGSMKTHPKSPKASIMYPLLKEVTTKCTLKTKLALVNIFTTSDQKEIPLYIMPGQIYVHILPILSLKFQNGAFNFDIKSNFFILISKVNCKQHFKP